MRRKIMRRRTRYAAFMGLCGFVASPACGDDDHGHDHNGEFRDFDRAVILDRGQSTPEEVAEWTHEEGWGDDDELPAAEVGEEGRVSLGMEVYDESGTQLIDADGEFTARYRLADGADEGVIDLDRDDDDLFHGDHVHIYGAEDGATEIVFFMWHGDHVHAEADPLEFRVSAD